MVLDVGANLETSAVESGEREEHAEMSGCEHETPPASLTAFASLKRGESAEAD